MKLKWQQARYEKGQFIELMCYAISLKTFLGKAHPYEKS
jgi:hypothetical protein